MGEGVRGRGVSIRGGERVCGRGSERKRCEYKGRREGVCVREWCEYKGRRVGVLCG